MVYVPKLCPSCREKLELKNGLPGLYLVCSSADYCEVCGEWKPLLIEEKSLFGDWAEYIRRIRTPPEA